MKMTGHNISDLILVIGERGARALLKKFEEDGISCFGWTDESATKLFESNNLFKSIDFNYDETFTDNFSQAYIDFIGEIGLRFKPEKWWITWTSSKNRFTSQLFNTLLRYHELLYALDNTEKMLAVVDPPPPIIKALKKRLQKEGKRIIILGNNPIGNLTVLIKERLTSAIDIADYLLRMFLRIFYTKLRIGGKCKKVLEKGGRYYVIKTFLYESSFPKNGGYKDAFFGVLPDFLKRKGKRVLIFAMSQAPLKRILEGIQNSNDFPVIPLEVLLTWRDLLLCLLRLLSYRLPIKNALFMNYDVTPIVADALARDLRESSPLIAIFHKKAVERLSQWIDIETLALTYENNPWEKMLILGLKGNSPETKIIGYQHTVIPRASINMFTSKKELRTMPMPDIIITTGLVNKETLLNYSAISDDMVKAGPALRFEYLFEMERSVRPGSRRLLLGLEGIFEVHHMVNYVLDELKDRRDIEITIRTHPVLPYSTIEHKIRHDIDSYPHVSLSIGKALMEDLSECDVLMYWGSTLGIEAMKLGIPIIHFDTGSLLSYDPLFEFKEFKHIVNTNSRLGDVLDKIFGMNSDEMSMYRDWAGEYIDRYFYLVTEENLELFLE